MEPEQVNAIQLRDSRSTLTMAWVSTLSDQSCMVALAHNLGVEVFGEEMPDKHASVITVITFQNNLTDVFSVGHTRRQHLNIGWGMGLNGGGEKGSLYSEINFFLQGREN